MAHLGTLNAYIPWIPSLHFITKTTFGKDIYSLRMQFVEKRGRTVQTFVNKQKLGERQHVIHNSDKYWEQFWTALQI
jgi:hypothetical protein